MEVDDERRLLARKREDHVEEAIQLDKEVRFRHVSNPTL